MNTAEQLLEMLKTIAEAESYLRKRCTQGQAGQSMALFDDLSSLLMVLDSRYRKSGYLPREHAPAYTPGTDVLSAVTFLDEVSAWTGRIRDRVERRRVRQELARGSLLEAVVSEGRPFAQQAVALSQMVKPPAAGTASVPTGSPEERVERDKGVSVQFSSQGRAAAAAPKEQAPPAQTAQAEAQPAAPEAPMRTPQELRSAVAEGERLFAGVRARTSHVPPGDPAFEAPRVASAQADDAGAMEGGGARPMGARPMRGAAAGEGGAKPMRAAEESGAKPMRAAEESGAKPMRAAEESGAKPMRAAEESGAKPMRTAEESGAKPMRAAEESGAKPMRAAEESGAKPMRAAEESGAKPMRAAEESGAKPMRAATPAQPKAPEISTAPADGRGNAIDREFLRILHEVGELSPQALEKKMIDGFPKLENRYKMVLCDHVRRFPILGTLEPDRAEFSLLQRRAQELSTHRDEYAWLYGKLGDYRSRKTLLALLDNWYSFNFKDLSNVKDKYYEMYLDADLLRCTGEEVFVDAGAGIGAITKAYCDFAGRWKKVYCYEPNPGNFTALKQMVKDFSFIETKQCAVSDRTGQQSLLWELDPLLGRLGDEGVPVETVMLDDAIAEPIDILKLCVEGSEQAAIRGASTHIHKDHPRLVMRADHGDSDLWQLPRMIERLDKKYRFFLRHYGGNIAPAEYALYAI